MPTFKKAAAPVAMLTALGSFLPDGLSPLDAAEDDEIDLAVCYPVYATEGPMLGDPMAPYLTSQTYWPEGRSEISRYSVRNLLFKDRAVRDAKLFQALRANVGGNRGGAGIETMHPECRHSRKLKHIRRIFKDELLKRNFKKEKNATAARIKRNGDDPKIAAFRLARPRGNLDECSNVQKEINLDNWEQSLATSQAGDLREVFRYVANVEGRKSPGNRPSRRDPMWDGDGLRVSPRRRRISWGAFFAHRMSQTQGAQVLSVEEARRTVSSLFLGG